MQTANTISAEQTYAEVALKAGLKLVREAIWQDDCCNWVTTQVGSANGHFQVLRSSCSPSVYSGVAGIALFLAHLSEANNDPLIYNCLEGAVNNLIKHSGGKEFKVFSYFSGKMGVADTLITIGKLKNNNQWVEKGWRMMESFKEATPDPEDLDVINGVAAVIPMLLRLYREHQHEWLKLLAEKCGELIMSKAVHSSNECSWITMSGNPGLTGYSHGNAGVSLALFELYNSSGNTQYLDLAMKGIMYERNLYNPSVQNWPDLRQMPGAQTPSQRYSQSWCHGAPGMVLPYIRAWQICKDNALLNDAHMAAITTSNGLYTANANFSLCHGISGNAEILHTAGILMNDQTMISKAHEAAKYGIEKVVNYRLQWPSGVSDPNGGSEIYENVSLMLGYAGTGYFYLRMAYPDRVPSVMMIGG